MFSWKLIVLSAYFVNLKISQPYKSIDQTYVFEPRNLVFILSTRKFETVDDILREFYTLRLEYYGKRKRYMEGVLGAEAARLSNQVCAIMYMYL